MSEFIDYEEKFGVSADEPLKHLAMLRDEWSDVIPSEVVSGKSKLLTKARKHYFVGIKADVENAIEENLINTPEQLESANKLFSRFGSIKFRKQKLVTQDDIIESNRLLDIILGRG
jgi:hypothetical protein